jgi:hypothetical protein
MVMLRMERRIKGLKITERGINCKNQRKRGNKTDRMVRKRHQVLDRGNPRCMEVDPAGSLGRNFLRPAR